MTEEDDSGFESCPVNRRQFMRLSAAAGGSLLLPGATTAQEVQSEKFSEVYEFVLNHTPGSQPVQTLVRLNDPSAFQEVENLEIPVQTTRELEPVSASLPRNRDFGG